MKLDRLLLCAALCWLLAACVGPAPRPAAAPSPTAAPSPAAALSSPTPVQQPAPPATPVAAGPALGAPVGLDGVLPPGTGGQPWWNDTVFYEIFVRSFFDSAGDGSGDLNGLIAKLDYLNDGDPNTSTDLGVTGLWLMPIMASPSYHGYDITDYYTVNPQYGAVQDFQRLVAEAHKRGIRVIVDLVLNHTSSQHPWFIEAQNPDSPKRDWYVWSDVEPQGKGWHPGKNGGYYYGYFGANMPDLNYKNPAVTEEMLKVTRFWLEEMGADGFRLDAIKYLVEDGRRIEHTPATHEWLQRFRAFYKGLDPQAFTVGEVWNDTGLASKYVGGELDAVFDFDLADATIRSAQNSEKGYVESAQKIVNASYPPGQFATFLANHDQPRTRTRLLDDAQAKTAATLQFAFPGVPFIYYGEEIGMMGGKPDENIRRPMQWTPEGGFTAGQPWSAYADDTATRNVAQQAADPDSILNHYRALIRLRNSHEALRIGEWHLVETGNDAVYAALRSTPNEQILVVTNLRSKPVSDYGLSLESGPLAPGARAEPLLGPAAPLAAPVVTAQGGFAGYRPVATLPPRASYFIQFVP